MLNMYVHAFHIPEIAKPLSQATHFLQRPVRKEADPENPGRLLRPPSRGRR